MSNVRTQIDPSLFTEPGAAMDLYHNSIRESLPYDAFGGKTRFLAKVISVPITVESGGTTGGNWSFRARIIEDPSPHWFIPNPCSEATAGDDKENQKLIALHTSFVGSSDDMPVYDGMVIVELEKNMFSYNLQHGKFIRVVNNPAEEPSFQWTSCIGSVARCEALAQTFDESEPWTGIPAKAEDIEAAYPIVARTKGLADKIVSVATAVGIPDPGWLANAIHFETSFTFDPSIQNKDTKATGLIQFIPKTAGGMNTSVDALKKMSAIKQMDYVKKYLMPFKGKLKTSADLYMAIFFPAAVGHGPRYSIYNYYVKHEGKSWADQKFLKKNNGIKTAGDYQALADRNAKMPTGGFATRTA
jgi:hypothetical protein